MIKYEEYEEYDEYQLLENGDGTSVKELTFKTRIRR